MNTLSTPTLTDAPAVLAAEGDLAHFAMTPDGPFSLALANEYFGGWPAFAPDPAAVAITFPVEGWRRSATVLMRQRDNGQITGDVYGAGADAARAWQQALATVSLDSAGAGWPDVGKRDPVLGRLQQRYGYLRPVLFHSPYEAAAAFIIGHRISIAQGRALRQAMSRAIGEPVAVGGETFYAFPRPQVLADLQEFPGLSAEKVRRLRGVAQAALDGLLDRTSLRAQPLDFALAQLGTLDGIGPFFAQGILLRGAGVVDDLTDDDLSKTAVQRLYQLPTTPDQPAMLQIAEAWRPYRMWANVLLHLWVRRDGGGPPTRSKAPGRRSR